MSRHRLASLAPLVFAACATPPGAVGSIAEGPPPVEGALRAYDPVEGFVVHEWGTLTQVLGSDGVPLPGLHHEEEDLPGFVADRLAGNNFPPATEGKLETPVTYFYSPAPRSVTVRVDFPRGIFTQWFPYAQQTWPTVVHGGGIVDPWLHTDLRSDLCRQVYGGAFTNGMLDWGTVDVLAPADPAALPSPLGNTTWAFARNTAANRVRVTNRITGATQSERFLFYRGLGNVAMPVGPEFQRTDGQPDFVPTFRNHDLARAMGGAFLMQVDAHAGSFVPLGDLGPGGTVSSPVPTARLPHTEFVPQLKAAVAARLVASGLYTDEARAMVDTWERSYFLTPGVRLLYLVPQTLTDELLPLVIAPAPDRTVRTLVIRVELLTPEYERQIGGWLDQLACCTPVERDAARAEFLGLGRFAEPHLRRAIALRPGSPAAQTAGQALLDEVQAHRRWAPTAAE